MRYVFLLSALLLMAPGPVPSEACSSVFKSIQFRSLPLEGAVLRLDRGSRWNDVRWTVSVHEVGRPGYFQLTIGLNKGTDFLPVKKISLSKNTNWDRKVLPHVRDGLRRVRLVEADWPYLKKDFERLLKNRELRARLSDLLESEG